MSQKLRDTLKRRLKSPELAAIQKDPITNNLLSLVCHLADVVEEQGKELATLRGDGK